MAPLGTVQLSLSQKVTVVVGMVANGSGGEMVMMMMIMMMTMMMMMMTMMIGLT